jgi:transglutaminase-like putative cysteine protease
MRRRCCWPTGRGTRDRRDYRDGRDKAASSGAFLSLRSLRSLGSLVAFFSFFSLAFLATAPLRAATVLEKSVDVEIRPDSVTERTHLRVRLDNPNDLSAWSPYPIFLDENRELGDLDASATRPDGKTLKVSRRDLDTRQMAGSGNLHSSLSARTVTFPAVPVGSVLALDYEVRERPYFPAGQLALGSAEAVDSLRVAIHGAGAGWRYHVDGATPGLTVQESPGGVTVTGVKLPGLIAPEKAPGLAADGAMLRYAWGDAGSWEAVGRWYEGILTQVPRGAGPVRSKARELVAGVDDKRRRIEALTAFARRQVRYVAVEVGIGGYRPHPPQQVMERLWGDCKDKALLLVDLLREAGIEAYPALARLDPEGRVDRDFPSPYQFNHMIVAVPADGLGLEKDAPVAGGYLFLDATQETGGLAWLQPAVQDQETLVVRGGKGELVRTPVHNAQEGRRLDVALALAAGGEASGTAQLELSGESGAAFVHLHAGANPQELDRVIRRVFAALLPAGAAVSEIRWQSADGGVPDVTLDAKVAIPALGAAGEGLLPPLPVPSMVDLPSSGLLEGRAVPVVETPFASRVTWRVTLPRDACKAEGQDVTVRNDLGAFRQAVAIHGRELLLERATELRQRWIDPAAFPALKEIGLAESRTNKRRLRVSCAG